MEDVQSVAADHKDNKKKKDSKKKRKEIDEDIPENELSEEDQQLKEDLQKHVKKLSNPSDIKEGLKELKSIIQTATSSMSQVPKPLKMLSPMYDEIKESFEKTSGDVRASFCDLMSVLSMTESDPAERMVLNYRLQCDDTATLFEDWGHEYVRHLVADINEAHREITTAESNDENSAQLKQIINFIPTLLKYLMKHKAEEACDLLLEVEQIDLILDFVSEENYRRVTLYFFSASAYLPNPDNVKALDICYQIFMKLKKAVDSLQVAIKLDSSEKVLAVFTAFEDVLVRKQLAYFLTWCQYPFPIHDEDELVDFFGDDDYDDFEEILSNTNMHETYLQLARELDVLEPKTPDEIYKEHLIDIKSSNEQVLSARKQLASTYVNAFVNVGFQNDKLMTAGEEKDRGSWIYKNKDAGMLAAAASLGLINFWSPDAVNKLEPYVTSDKDHIKAGAFLGQGLSCAGYDTNVAFGLLEKHLDSDNADIRVATILGLGFAQCGKPTEELKEKLQTFLYHEQPPMIRAAACIALGMVLIGTRDDEIMGSIFEMLQETPPEEAESDTTCIFYALSLGLLYFQAEEEHEVVLELMEVLKEMGMNKLYRSICVLVEACAYAGTGNVLQIQKLLSVAGEHPPEPEKKSEEEEEEEKEEKEEKEKEPEKVWHQSLAVIGLAVVSIGEKYGSAMLTRMMNHLIQYGEPSVRRAVPLCLALASVSKPEMMITDILSKLSHDNDLETVNGAILALGLVSAGTNNSRVATMLRNLMQYHQKNPEQLFLIRISLGFLHMGKGLVSLSPVHSNNMLVSKVGVAGLLTLLVSCLDYKNNILGQRHYLLYALSVSIRPRMLTILDENCQPKKINVRVGTEVDIVGMVGNQKNITAFQTHETPVIIHSGQRAEIVLPEKYISLSEILEGFVVVKENPDYNEDEDQPKKSKVQKKVRNLP